MTESANPLLNNAFFGSYDKVLQAMDAHLPVQIVVSPRRTLRNMRLEQRLRARGVQWYDVADREEFSALLTRLPELHYCVVAGFSWMIPQLQIERSRAVINFHPGDLLRCRGPQPLAAALYHQHPHLGACAHLIDSQALDCGPLLARDLLTVEPQRDYSWHHQQLMQLLATQAGRVCSELASGVEPMGQAWAVEQSQWYPRLQPALLAQLYTAPTLARFWQTL